MMKKMLLGGLVWAAGCATTYAEPVNERAAAILDAHERTGEVVNCLNLRQVSSIVAIDEETLLIKSGVNDYYVNELSGRCNGATRNSTRFEYATSIGQLCRNDILKVVDNSGGFLTGSCGVGSFERLATKEPAEEETETE
ncbi:MAG: DUF6491 family protein [Parvularculaceae bacterium]|nr:hypothetical protein [Parvularculaceae bacterium]